ncbi:P protein [Anastrepha ludens]|uniref:P protein n=1 Tax=Anastrepha ludens TaxID=28586 RepID=UPI0023B1DF40|nr:P protein [Anastrepha ludens]
MFEPTKSNPVVTFQANMATKEANNSNRRRRFRKNQRLRGGMEKNDKYEDIDEFNLDDADEEFTSEPQKQKKTLRLNLPKPVEEPTPPEPETRLQKAFHYIKVGFFCAVWLIIALLLPMMPIEKLEGFLTIIFPNQTTSIIVKTQLISREALGLRAYGPFLIGGDASNIDPGENKHLSAYLELVHVDTNQNRNSTKIVSNMQYFLLSNTKGLDYVKPVKMYGHFGLRNFSKKDIAANEKLRLLMHTNINEELTIKYYFERSLDASIGIILGALVLVFLYISIIWELMNRTFVALIAATLAIGVLGFMRSWPKLSKIMKWMDTETLLLLFGMMVLVGILAESGIFDFFAVYAYKLSRGHIWPMVNTLCFFTATISAFLDSVTMMLLITPIVVKLCEVMQSDPVLVLMFLVIYANVGAASTPVGDPPNIIITTNSFIASHNINFGNFMLHTLPCVVLALLQTYIQIRLTFRKLGRVPYHADVRSELRQSAHAWERAAAAIQPYSKDTTQLRKVLMKKAERVKNHIIKIGKRVQPTANYEETLAELRSSYGIRNKTLLIKSSIAFVFVIVLFFMHSVHLHQLSLGEAALIGAICLLILADIRDMEAILGRIEWSTLIFFGSLFVLMEALTEIGVISVLGNMVQDIIFAVSEKHRLLVTLELVLWVSAISSAFLNNIPVTTMMIRIVISLSENKELGLPLHPMVWALALGTCFGGNGTLIGGSANVATAGVAEQHGYNFTFKRFFFVGFPLMIGNVIITSVYLYVCHVVFQWHEPPTNSSHH